MKNISIGRLAWTSLLVITAVAAAFAYARFARVPASPELALKLFFEREVAEDQIMDPLILAGPPVVPLLLREVTNRDMPNRRYAIGALGNLGTKAALESLVKLSRDTSEDPDIRCDALLAVGMLDPAEGLRIATSINSKELDCLWNVADHAAYLNWINTGAPRRTYLEALLGWHR